MEQQVTVKANGIDLRCVPISDPLAELRLDVGLVSPLKPSHDVRLERFRQSCMSRGYRIELIPASLLKVERADQGRFVEVGAGFFVIATRLSEDPSSTLATLASIPSNGSHQRDITIGQIESDLEFARVGKNLKMTPGEALNILRAFRQLIRQGKDPSLALDLAKDEIRSGDDGNAANVFHARRNSKTARGGSQARG